MALFSAVILCLQACGEDSGEDIYSFSRTDAVYDAAVILEDGEEVRCTVSTSHSGEKSVVRITLGEVAEVELIYPASVSGGGKAETADAERCTVFAGGVKIPVSKEASARLSHAMSFLVRGKSDSVIASKSEDGSFTVLRYPDGTIKLSPSATPCEIDTGVMKVRLWEG